MGEISTGWQDLTNRPCKPIFISYSYYYFQFGKSWLKSNLSDDPLNKHVRINSDFSI
jgi:hypothetical protein